jgi:hypothetical protein
MRLSVVVLVDAAASEPTGERSSSRPSGGERRALVEERRRSERPVLDRIDHVLRCEGGSRLADDVDALGAVPVETTPIGVRRLAALDGVTAVLKDQPVRGLA